jgi:NTE family protein
VFADGQSLTAFGANPLDPACRVPSARAGREQGRRVAGDIAEFFD